MKAWETDLGQRRERVHVRVGIERYAFRCLSCERRWASTYEVREYTGPTGAQWVVCCRDGEPVAGPYFGARCPGCRRVSVTFEATPEESPAAAGL